MAGKKQPAPTKPSSSSKGGGAGKLTRNQKPPQQTTENRESEEDLRRQQALLNIFSNTFREVLEAGDFAAQLQELKGALFNRDFEGAFAREAALDVYAARWSPTRALCYARILRGLDPHLRDLVGENETGVREGGETARDESVDEEDVRNTEDAEQEASAERRDSSKKTLKILAIGGAAAEIVAFADYISSQPTTTTTMAPFRGEITLLDIGPWGSVSSRLESALTSTPPISQYASAAAKAANAALVPPSRFRSSFVQKDILSLPEAELATLIPENNTPILITLLFTLNELYTAGGIKRTTTFLRQLSSSPDVNLAPGSLLLVVDSPGSYSEAAVGGRDVKKRYPMQWLLEHTLIPPPPPSRRKKTETEEEEGEEGGDPSEEGDRQKPEEGDGGVRWEKIESHDSLWFRVAEGLRYPISLENMRYQMHLYRACVG
ncbi:hypothetical protein F4680DRAFT_197533 [Xylaria scruposa]|nr:hypothetical protein F4680DRAFT_197533 [Xylaria scruposa]